MSIVDVGTRITNDYPLYSSTLRSSDSLIYVNNDGRELQELMPDGPTSLELTIGNRCFIHDKGTLFDFPADGFKLRSGQSILVETLQEVALPYNIFGLVTGKGKLIFSGLFLSTGKIDPGFNGSLKIGIHNGGPKTITLRPNDPLCTCVFFRTESSLQNKTAKTNRLIQPAGSLVTKWRNFINYIDANKSWITVILAALTFITVLTFNLLNYYKKSAELNKPATQNAPSKITPLKTKK